MTAERRPVELELEAGGLSLAACAWGPEDGHPVLALHGWLDNAASFWRLAPLLVDTRVVAVDLAGHGHSGHRPAGVPYHFVDYVSDGFAVAEALGWERFSLLGHSLGAGIAAVMAGTMPERVAALVLLEGLGPLSSRPEEAPSRLRKAALQMALGTRRSAPPYASFEEAVAARLSWTSDVDHDAAVALCARGLRRESGGFAWRSDARLRFASPVRLTEPQVLAFIAAIEAPTLLMLGDRGYAYDRAVFRSRVAAHKCLDVATLPGRHHLHMEPGVPAVADRIRRFLSARTN